MDFERLNIASDNQFLYAPNLRVFLDIPYPEHLPVVLLQKRQHGCNFFIRRNIPRRVEALKSPFSSFAENYRAA